MNTRRNQSGFGDVHPAWPLGSWVVGLLVCMGLMVIGGGCSPKADAPSANPTVVAAPPVPPPPTAPITATDPCASRLHDIAGGLLLYYARNNRLPERLSDLSEIPGMRQVDDLVCPVSGKPYLYSPGGIIIPGPGPGARLVVYDPTPAHDGMRWAIRVEEPTDGSPLVARVIALPESFFLLRPPE